MRICRGCDFIVGFPEGVRCTVRWNLEASSGVKLPVGGALAQKRCGMGRGIELRVVWRFSRILQKKIEDGIMMGR